MSARGAKHDNGKPPIVRGVLQYFPRALAQVALLSDVGARKYEWKGWEAVPDGRNRYSDALGRHLLLEEVEANLDAETGLAHDVAVAWNALARLELRLRDEA